MELVLARLQQYGLRVKPSKCHFAQPQVKLLGYLVNKQGIATDPDKVEAIVKLPPPTNIKQVRSFLGTAGYYRQCVPKFAYLAKPLTALTRKNAKFVWSAEHQHAFDSLKNMLVSSHVMAHPDPSKPYILYTDASDTCIGAILVQKDKAGVERVIQYVSHQLSPTQQCWSTVEVEAWAIVYALQKLRTYLFGADFTVYSDHKPLMSLFSGKEISKH